ncbi:MAG: helix-turn-helix domain-containing protein [Acidimicrobiales bacterium]
MRVTNDLATSLRARRLELGLTQAELAGRAGVARSWLASVERGKPGAEVGLILRLLDALGLSLHIGASDRDEPTRERRTTARVDIDELLERLRTP